MSAGEMNTRERKPPPKSSEHIGSDISSHPPTLSFFPTRLLGDEAVRPKFSSAHMKSPVKEGSRGVAANMAQVSLSSQLEKVSPSTTRIPDYLASLVVKSP